MGRVCEQPNCPEQPSNGIEGSRRRQFCSRHAIEGMVDICSKHPSFGVKRSGRRQFCARHAADGMVDVSSKRCRQEGCSKYPSFGVKGSGRRQEGCSKYPSFGVKGSGKRMFCSRHAEDGMMDIANKRCTQGLPEGCELWRGRHRETRILLRTCVRGNG
ncbi:unnamed protein product [Ectocarpus sp. CCAP 1310/34]|nr:unnamed protein product [Ectocarpus sp. CCAP 1310/34]